MTTDLCISFAPAALCPLIAGVACLLPRLRKGSAPDLHSPQSASPLGEDAAQPPTVRRFPTAGDVTCALLYYAFFCAIRLPLFGEEAGCSAPEPQSLLSAALTVAASLAVYLPLLLLAFEHKGSGFLRSSEGKTPTMGRLARLFLLSLAAVFAFSLLYQYTGLSDLILKLSGARELQSVCELIAQTSSPGALVLMGLNTILIAPVCEEILWRGYVFNILRTRCRPIAAAATSGLLFGAIHFAVPQFLILSFFGFVLALAYERSRSLLMPIALHITFNAINFTLLLT